jgi:hypothetical protein
MGPNIFLSPALGVVIETINHGTVALLQHLPAVPVLLVCLHQDTEQEHHAPVPAAFQGYIKLCAGSHVERRRRDEEDIVHPHVLVVAAQQLAVYELLAEEVFVPNIKAAEDLDLTPFPASAPTLVTHTFLQEPHQPSDVAPFQLVVSSIGWREPEFTEPVTVKIVQKIANFPAEIFEMLVFHYILCVPYT